MRTVIRSSGLCCLNTPLLRSIVPFLQFNNSGSLSKLFAPTASLPFANSIIAVRRSFDCDLLAHSCKSRACLESLLVSCSIPRAIFVATLSIFSLGTVFHCLLFHKYQHLSSVQNLNRSR